MAEENEALELQFAEGATPQFAAETSLQGKDSNDAAAENEQRYAKRTPVCPPWTLLTEGLLHQWTRRFVVALSTHAARNPKTCVASVALLSLLLAGVGLLTNFRAEFDQQNFLTPQGSLPDKHNKWIHGEGGFQKIRVFWAALHSDGDNILTAQAMRQAVETMETIYSAPDFESVCSQSQFLDYHTHQPTCRIFTVSQFWDHNRTLLEEQLQDFKSVTERDAFVRRVVSQDYFPDGTPVFHEAILGNYVNETVVEAFHNLNVDTTTINDKLHINIQSPSIAEKGWFITSAQSLVIKVDLPDLGAETDVLEQQMLDKLANLRHRYRNRRVQLEYFTITAYQQEFQRAMNQDMPLVFVLTVVMISFTSFVFWRPKEKVHSRALLGVYSFVTIGMSLLSGYGFMFICGIPLTSVAIMIPFVVVGVALDDTFIITGAYFRLLREREQQELQQSTSGSNEDATVAVIRETMEEVGTSISMTTWTTLLCFFLGSVSSIPAVEWLCFYAATTIGFDFIYQITFFIALLTLDERRVQANRRDVCFWIVVNNEEETAPENQSTDDGKKSSGTLDKNFMERFVSWYSDKLLQPQAKIVVIFVFLAYFLGCCYSTTLLRQEFNVGDYVPEDSMLTSFTVAFQEYTSIQRFIGVYFRNVDQSDPQIHEQMMEYVQELSELPQIGEPPHFFWARDFKQLAESDQARDEAERLGIDMDSLTFNEQVDIALNIPPIRSIYAQDIVRDEESGNITASRTFLYLRTIDMKDIKDQMNMLMEQREITQAQPINSPEKLKDGELSFFSFDDFYFFWELYSITVDELIYTTVSCVAVVSLIALVYIPHWTAVLFVTPLIIMLYFMMLGTMQYCGIKVHSITYFIVIMAIGLLVDFLMHILLRYYETKGATRHAKVKETLETMGTSILLGGFTTWLGVIPLAFSTTKTFRTTFICFLSMVTLGCSVGLALLPVLLSIVGPVDQVEPPSKRVQAEDQIGSQKTAATTLTESQSQSSDSGQLEAQRSSQQDGTPSVPEPTGSPHTIQVKTEDGEYIGFMQIGFSFSI